MHMHLRAYPIEKAVKRHYVAIDTQWNLESLILKPLSDDSLPHVKWFGKDKNLFGIPALQNIGVIVINVLMCELWGHLEIELPNIGASTKVADC